MPDPWKLSLRWKTAIRCCAAARKISMKASGPSSKSESRSISDDNKKLAESRYFGRRNMEGNAATVLAKPAFRKIEWLKRDIAVDRRADGSIVLKSRIPLQAYEKHIPASLAKWARQAPERIWLAQRGGTDREWRKVSYGEAKRTVDALTQGLLNLGVAEGRPVAILSGNSIEHALMTQAAMQARLPAAPVSPAYSLMSHDHAKLKYLFSLIKPAGVMGQDGPPLDRG